jgi:hypothetical protein
VRSSGWRSWPASSPTPLTVCSTRPRRTGRNSSGPSPATASAWTCCRLVFAVLALALLWPGIGFVQRERAIAAQARLAATRGEPRQRGAVFPTVGNTIVWRSIYQTGNRLRIDRIRVPWPGQAMYASTGSVPLASAGEVRGDARMLRDFARFAWFSDGWVARAPADPSILGDARYSLRADRYDPVWGIRFRAEGSPTTEWINRTRERDVGMAQLWTEITGKNLASGRWRSAMIDVAANGVLPSRIMRFRLLLALVAVCWMRPALADVPPGLLAYRAIIVVYPGDDGAVVAKRLAAMYRGTLQTPVDGDGSFVLALSAAGADLMRRDPAVQSLEKVEAEAVTERLPTTTAVATPWKLGNYEYDGSATSGRSARTFSRTTGTDGATYNNADYGSWVLHPGNGNTILTHVP